MERTLQRDFKVWVAIRISIDLFKMRKNLFFCLQSFAFWKLKGKNFKILNVNLLLLKERKEEIF